MRGVLTLLVATGLALLAACDSRSPDAAVHELVGGAMGTSFSIKIVRPPDTPKLDELRAAVEEQLAMIEQQMSTYIADSEISRFNAQRSVDWFTVSSEFCTVVAEALTLSAATGGAFDVTVGPLVNLWGFGPTGSVAEPPDRELVAGLLDTIGYTSLHADCSVPALRKDLQRIVFAKF